MEAQNNCLLVMGSQVNLQLPYCGIISLLISRPSEKPLPQISVYYRNKLSILALTTEMSIWENNVMVTPLERAYTKEDMEPYYGKPIEIEDDEQIEEDKSQEKVG
jgi:hypothetical protein